MSIQHCTGDSRQCNKKRKKKFLQITNKEVKLSLFVEDMIVYIDNFKGPTN